MFPEEEREEQGADVRAVDIGVGHDHDAVVAGLLEIELVADPRADRGDQGLDLEVLQDLVQARLLDVEDLAADRQDRLRRRVARRLRRAAGRVALNDVQLAAPGIVQLAVGELAGQRPPLQERLAAGEVARLLRGPTRLGGRLRLLDDALGLARVLLEPFGEPRVDGGLDERAHRCVAELGLGLALELRVFELDRHDRDQALADVLADQVVVLLLEDALGARVAVEHVGEGLLEALSCMPPSWVLIVLAKE